MKKSDVRKIIEEKFGIDLSNEGASERSSNSDNEEHSEFLPESENEIEKESEKGSEKGSETVKMKKIRSKKPIVMTNYRKNAPNQRK